MPEERVTTGSEPSITHIAANDITIGGQRLRQRCAWCGAILIDYDLTRVAVATAGVNEDEGIKPPSTWPVGGLVRVTGTFPVVSSVLPETEELPDDACGRIDDEVTAQ
jgi:hypothetical protein